MKQVCSLLLRFCLGFKDLLRHIKSRMVPAFCHLWGQPTRPALAMPDSPPRTHTEIYHASLFNDTGSGSLRSWYCLLCSKGSICRESVESSPFIRVLAVYCCVRCNVVPNKEPRLWGDRGVAFLLPAGARSFFVSKASRPAPKYKQPPLGKTIPGGKAAGVWIKPPISICCQG